MAHGIWGFVYSFAYYGENTHQRSFRSFLSKIPPSLSTSRTLMHLEFEEAGEDG
jgi:hypothetical protein